MPLYRWPTASLIVSTSIGNRKSRVRPQARAASARSSYVLGLCRRCVDVVAFLDSPAVNRVRFPDVNHQELARSP